MFLVGDVQHYAHKQYTSSLSIVLFIFSILLLFIIFFTVVLSYKECDFTKKVMSL